MVCFSEGTGYKFLQCRSCPHSGATALVSGGAFSTLPSEGMNSPFATSLLGWPGISGRILHLPTPGRCEVPERYRQPRQLLGIQGHTVAIRQLGGEMEDTPMGIFLGIGNGVLIGPFKVIDVSLVMEFYILLLSSSFPFLRICTYSPSGAAVFRIAHSAS